jgi:hypothetical protein
LTHVQLFTYVSKRWGDIDKTHRDLHQAYDDFVIDIDSTKLHIANVAGEQAMLTELHSLADKYDTNESNKSDQLNQFFRKLVKKFDKKNTKSLRKKKKKPFLVIQ